VRNNDNEFIVQSLQLSGINHILCVCEANTAVTMLCTGMSLAEVGDLLKAHGCHLVSVVHAVDSSVDKFRQQSIEALSHADSSTAVIVNYHMETLGL